MASTYSSLKIELIGTGDQAGTWGNTTNTNLGTALEEAITGSANVTFASSNAAIALTDTNASQTARNLRLNLVGTITNVQTLFVPPIKKQYLVTNGLSNSVIISNGTNASPTGTTVTIPTGRSVIIFNDATNIAETVSYVSNLALGTVLGLISGGTGANSAPAAMANLMGFTTTATAGSNTVLTNTSSYYQIFTGTANQNVSLPVVSTLSNGWTFHICNNSTGSLAVLSSGSNTVITVPSQVTAMCTVISTSGTTEASWEAGLTDFSTSTGNGSVVLSNNATLGNVSVNAYVEGVIAVGNTGNAVTINIANATIVTATLTANCTFTMPGNTAGRSFILLLKTGNGSFTGTFTSVKWVGNTAPTITTANNSMDILTFIADGANWYGNYAQGYVP